MSRKSVNVDTLVTEKESPVTDSLKELTPTLDKLNDTLNKFSDIVTTSQQSSDKSKTLDLNKTANDLINKWTQKPTTPSSLSNSSTQNRAEGPVDLTKFKVPTASEGGKFHGAAIVGEGKSGKPGPDAELAVGDFNIYNREQLNRQGINLDSLTTSTVHAAEGLPRFALGTPGEIGQTLGSAGGNTSGAQMGSEAIDIGTTVGSTIANAIVPGTGLIVQAFGQAAQAVTGLVDGFNKLAEEIKVFSASILSATIEYDIKKLEQDMKFGEKYGADIAEVYTASGDAWLEVREELLKVAISYKDDLIPLIGQGKDALLIIIALLKMQIDFSKKGIDIWKDFTPAGRVWKLFENGHGKLSDMLTELAGIRKNTDKDEQPIDRMRSIIGAARTASIGGRSMQRGE